MENIDVYQRERDYIENLIKSREYPLEIHTVTTEDGYILTVYRIKHGKNCSERVESVRPPVLLIHGLLASCAEWLNVEHSISYFLADNGFDVWIGNCRGTTYSRKHINLNMNEDRKKYWDFSWHEIGYYDIPAFIDFVLQTTNFSKILYIGHSQGTTAFMALMSSRLDYNGKICLCIMLAPSGIYNNNTVADSMGKYTSANLQVMERLFGASEIPFVNIIRRLFRIFTKPDFFGNKIFYFVLFNFYSKFFNWKQLSELEIHEMYNTSPNTASLKQVLHYRQILTDKRFRRYDYGLEQNKELYGSEIPPDYDLSKVTAPVALFTAKNDVFLCPEDAELLSEMLGNVVYKYMVERESFGHLDFVFAEDLTSALHIHVLDIMKKYITEDMCCKP